jgi:hypothetical protein
MSKPLDVLTIITAAGCGPCEVKRGKGIDAGLLKEPANNAPPTILGGHYWNQAFFRKALTGTIEGANIGSTLNLPILPAKMRLYEIHCKEFNASIEPLELNEFILIGNQVVRFSYTKDKKTNKVMLNITQDGKTTKQTAPVAENFMTFIRTKIPEGIDRFVRGFPAFIYTDGNNWDNALKGIRPLYSHIQGIDLIKIGNKDNYPIYGVNRQQQGRGEIDPLLFITKIIPDKNGNVLIDIASTPEMLLEVIEHNKLIEDMKNEEEMKESINRERIEKEIRDKIDKERIDIEREEISKNNIPEPIKYIAQTYCNKLPYRICGR